MNRTARFILAGTVAASLVTGMLTAPARAAGAPAPAALLKATNDFGYWNTYFAANAYTPRELLKSPAYVNARIKRDIDPRLLRRLPSHSAGEVLGLMHLMNTPDGYRFRVDRYDGSRASETLRWLFGRNPHTPIVRLDWINTGAGWKLSNATFLRNS